LVAVVSVLVVNSGGVTLDLAVVDHVGTTLATQLIDPWDGSDVSAIGEFASRWPSIERVAHRVVHSGRLPLDPLVIDRKVELEIANARTFAPLHQERCLAAIRAARDAFADLPHIACFDSAFHRTIPERAKVYAVPAEWRHRWTLDRRGFHGFSHQHVARVAEQIAATKASKIVSCHLASGSSLCALLNGVSTDTTMGFTPIEGLVMATRSGSVDPGVVIWLIEEAGLTAAQVKEGLTHDGGMRALAGGTGDMRDVLDAASKSDDNALLAFDVYAHRLRQAIASMAASIGGVDILAFTGGIGEHVAAVRSAAVQGLEFLGLSVDDEQNNQCYGVDADITGTADGEVRTIVVATGEHVELAAAARTASDS
jgi:acetate kinase